MLFCYRYLGDYQKADIMWSAYCKKSSLQYGATFAAQKCHAPPAVAES